jgi:uncharacterized protein (DUF488 family)
MRWRTTLYTIGHSTHAIGDFIGMLERYAIEVLVDVRTVPQSRRNPQFGQQSLRQSLQSAGIEYVHMKCLGGLRPPAKDSTVNAGWRNKSFRGYADYMQTPEFGSAVEELIELGAQKRTAMMCAEAVPWRCHRSLVGDALLVRGVEVIDIMNADKSMSHALTPFADVAGTDITYPAAQGALGLPPATEGAD